LRQAGDGDKEKSAKKVIEKTTPIYITDIYDELPEVIAHVRKIFSSGTTETGKGHLMSAGLIKPLTLVG
jgi:hypothetical protein